MKRIWLYRRFSPINHYYLPFYIELS